MRLNFIRQFIKFESTSGIILLIMALFAMIIDNSPWSSAYQQLFKLPLEIGIAQWNLTKPITFWINDGLMTLFFLLIGLELKREFLTGKLAMRSSIILPAIAAIGGMLVPAMIYIAFNYHNPDTLYGWPIPIATDVAFTIGILSLFGSKIPPGLKSFVMALTIFDDVGAIIIIAIFYENTLSYTAMILSFMTLIAFYGLMHIARYRFFCVLLGILFWYLLLKSGIHPTLAGVLLACVTPLPKVAALEKALHPIVAYLIMPLFAFVNAGFSLSEVTTTTILSSITLGVLFGLWIGKPLGILIALWTAIKLKFVKFPAHINKSALIGAAMICGVGFTMSLFLGTLSFESSNLLHLTEMRLGILLGSLFSGIIGTFVLYGVIKKS